MKIPGPASCLLLFLLLFSSCKIIEFTEPESPISDIRDIDVALLPIGTGKTAMNPSKAAEAVELINPRYVIPMHYEPATDSLKSFMNQVDPDIQIIHANYSPKPEKP